MNTIPLTHTTIDGIHIAEAVAGEVDASPVVLLHGWGANISLVWPLAKQLAPHGYRIYMLDLPGFGESDPPPSAWTIHDYVRFVLAYLEHHQLERVYLFGHSFGGRLGLILGAEHPDRIMKMVLANSAGLHQKAPLSDRIRLRSYKAVRDALNAVGMGRLSDSLRRWYNARYGSADFQRASGVMRQTFVNIVNEDLQSYATCVRRPTLLFWGDQDEETPLSMGQRLEQLIPDAGLVVYEGAGHYSYLDRLPDAVRVMVHFFKQD